MLNYIENVFQLLWNHNNLLFIFLFNRLLADCLPSSCDSHGLGLKI